jgi:hypothetical protein
VLAPALRPFAAQVRLFDPAVPDGVGPWLLPLLHVLGPMRVPTDAASGDPDGYSGIARRGPYDRLLASEWLFALDEPDEFIRRAVMDEHMFLARHFRDPSGATTSVALFDAGPLQLGAPRLAQIALLLVLARRAAAANAVFRFGILQAPEAGLMELDIAAIARWTRARSWAPAELHLDTWREQVAVLAPSDLWVVGAAGTRSVATALGAHAVAIDEVDDADRPALHIQTHRRDAVGAAITLPLPEPNIAIAVLRDPVARRAMPDARTVTTQSKALGRLSLDGRRLLLPNKDGGLDALHIPGTPREPIGRPKHVPMRTGFTLVAVDMFERRPIALYERNDKLFIAGSGLFVGPHTALSAAASLGEIHDTELGVPASVLVRERGDLVTLHVVTATTKKLVAWIVDGAQQLWALTLEARDDTPLIDGSSLELRDQEAANFTRQNAEVVGWASGSIGTIVTTPPLREWEIHDGDGRTCLFGGAEPGQPVTLAYRSGNDLIVYRDGPTVMTPPKGRLFGLVWRYESTGQSTPHLLYVDTSERAIRWKWPTGDEVLAVATEPIAEIRYEPWCRKILYLTTGGQRGVYSIERKTIVWRSIPEVPP